MFLGPTQKWTDGITRFSLSCHLSNYLQSHPSADFAKPLTSCFSLQSSKKSFTGCGGFSWKHGGDHADEKAPTLWMKILGNS
jgi:hypothetical protein